MLSPPSPGFIVLSLLDDKDYNRAIGVRFSEEAVAAGQTADWPAMPESSKFAKRAIDRSASPPAGEDGCVDCRIPEVLLPVVPPSDPREAGPREIFAGPLLCSIQFGVYSIHPS